MAAALLDKVLPFGLFETRRLLGAAIGLVGLAATWRIGRRIGGPLAGLIALVLLATCPLYYGHMFINPKDAPFAAAMAIFLLGLVRLIEQYPKPSPTTIALVGLGFGLSIGSRIMAGFGVVEALFALALLFGLEAHNHGARKATARLGRLLLMLLPAAVLAYAVMALLWPWSVTNPFNPIIAIEIFSRFFEKPWQELFAGQLHEPLDMPRSYVPTLLAVKLPELFTILALAGVLHALVVTVRPAATPPRRAIYFALALAAILPIAVTVITRPAMYNGVRHFVFVLPPLAIAGGLAGSLMIERALLFGRVALALVVAVLLAGLALPVINMARLHPYEYASFNTISGGVGAARERYMLDYWGLAFKQAGEALRERARRPRRGAAGGPQVEGRSLRPASAGADRAWRRLRADVGYQGRRFCAQPWHLLLRATRRPGAGRDRARRRELRARLRPARPQRREPVHRSAGAAELRA